MGSSSRARASGLCGGVFADCREGRDGLGLKVGVLGQAYSKRAVYVASMAVGAGFANALQDED